MKRAMVVALLMVAASCEPKPVKPKGPPPTPIVGATVTLGGKTLKVNWVRNDPERMSVLCDRGAFDPSTAILIGYGHERILHHFSTRTTLPFDIAWISKELKIIETALLDADSESGVTSSVEAQYALALPGGALAGLGVKSGSAVVFSEEIRALPAIDLPTLRVGGVEVHVEVSENYDERTRGLMWRRRISDHDGMLFIYKSPHELHFWMGNCYFPLDIAFFDAKGNFLNVVPMKTYPDPAVDTNERAASKGDAKYVLEVNLGWFKAKGLCGGDGAPLKELRLEMPPDVRAAAEEAD